MATNNKQHKKISTYILLLAYGFILFSYGFSLAKYKIFPYSQLKFLKYTAIRSFKSPQKPVQSYSGEDEILEFAFTDPLITPRLYEPCKTIDDLHRHLAAMLVDVDKFCDSYCELMVSRHSFINESIFTVSYKLRGSSFSAHCYFKPKLRTNLSTRCAFLVIPGGGHNVSSSILAKDAKNVHGNILDIVNQFGDTYIFVKPNEDFLAIHNGTRKLNYKFVTGWLLNRGGSYSAHYIINTMAITNWLKTKYDKVFVIGLSLGGEAALLNALHSSPTAVIVASGFSVLYSKVRRCSHMENIIPGIYSKLNLRNIHDSVLRSKTKFLFTYGKKEIMYPKMEAQEAFTANFFHDCSNVRCVSHDGGHFVPKEITQEFILSHAMDN